MHIELHHGIPDREELRSAWNALVNDMARPEIFYRWEWAKAMESAYAVEFPPILALAYEGSALVGVAALALLGNRVEFLSGTTADYCDFISAPEKRGSFVEAALRKLRSAGCEEIAFANLPRESATVSALKSAGRRAGFYAFERLAYVCAGVQLGSTTERQKLRSTLEKKQWFRRKMSALESKAAVGLEHLTAWEQVEPLLAQFAQLHVSRFLSTQRVSNLLRPNRRLFLHELAQRLCDSGGFCLTRLKWGDAAIAWNYGFRFAGSWFWYQPAIQVGVDKYSPGMVMLAHIITESCGTPEIQVVDLGLGAEGYKEQFANCTRQTLHLTLTRSLARHLHAGARYGAAQFIKKWPAGEKAARRMLAKAAEAGAQGREFGIGKTLTWAARGAKSLVGSRESIYFHDCSPLADQHDSCGFSLRALDWDTLARVAMEYWEDESTLNYLFRCGQFLSTGKYQGYALVNAEKRTAHFTWTASFEEFQLPGFDNLLSPEKDLILIFDPWIPPGLRERTYYADALRLVARKLIAKGKKPWACNPGTNEDAIRALTKAGCRLRYSLTRKRILWQQRIESQLTAYEEKESAIAARV